MLASSSVLQNCKHSKVGDVIATAVVVSLDCCVFDCPVHPLDLAKFLSMVRLGVGDC